jgi:hypothetical protein
MRQKGGNIMSKIYAVIGTNSMTIVADTVKYNPQTNEVLMQSERPADGDYIANEQGEWVEDKQKAIEELDATYNRDKTELANYFLEATITGDTDLQDELKAEIEQLNADYDEKRRELEGE